MGCSDVSECEHIYGQILTTPSCVYGRLFTWTKWWILMHWSCERRFWFFDKVKSMGIDSCLYEIPKNDWINRPNMKLCHRSRPPMCTVTSSKCWETSLGKSWKHTTLWFPGGSSHCRCWSAILVTTAMTQPSSFSILLWLLPLPLLNEGLEVSQWENCGNKYVCMYVLEHFGGLMRLIIFPWN